MVLFRWHRGSLADSMETVQQVRDQKHLGEVVGEVIPFTGELEVLRYCYDDRIGWDTYIVKVDGLPVGFTNGVVEEVAE